MTLGECVFNERAYTASLRSRSFEVGVRRRLREIQPVTKSPLGRQPVLPVRGSTFPIPFRKQENERGKKKRKYPGETYFGAVRRADDVQEEKLTFTFPKSKAVHHLCSLYCDRPPPHVRDIHLAPATRLANRGLISKSAEAWSEVAHRDSGRLLSGDAHAAPIVAAIELLVGSVNSPRAVWRSD